MDIVTFALGKKYTNKSIASAMIGAKSITQENDKIKIVTFDDTVFYLDVDGLFTDAEREKLASFSDDLSRLDISDTGEILIDGSLVKADSVTTADIVSTVECGAIKVGDRVKAATNLQGVVEQLLIKEEKPSVILTISVSDGNTYDTIREKGINVTATCKATIAKKTYNISKVDWISGIIATETNVSATGGTFTRTLSASSDVTIICRATDTNNLTGSASKILSFVNPMYTAYINKDIDTTTITEDMVTGGAKLLKKKNTFTTDKIVLDKEKFCFAYDSSYGVLSSIKDVNNNFECINAFNRIEMDITTADGTIVKYYVYLMKFGEILEDSDNFKYQIKW